MENKDDLHDGLKSLLSVSDVCKLLGVSNITLYRLIKKKEIKCFKFKHSFNFKKEYVDEYIENLTK